jgi:hypothetical protein
MNYEFRKLVVVENAIMVVALEDDFNFMFEDMNVKLIKRKDNIGIMIEVDSYDVMVSSEDGEIKNENLAVVSKIIDPAYLASEVWTAVRLDNPDDYRSDVDIHRAVVKLLSKTING